MRKVDRYNAFCLLAYNLNSKAEALNEVSNLKGKLEFEVNSIKREISNYSDITNLSSHSIQAIQRSQISECLNQNSFYEEGGSVSEPPVKSFKKSNEYSDYSSRQMKLYTIIEPSLLHHQYSIQTALSILDDGENDIDVYDNTTIEDFIDQMMQNMNGYNALPTKELKEIKKIIYNFVEHTSKF